jgi:hypothetical protein
MRGTTIAVLAWIGALAVGCGGGGGTTPYPGPSTPTSPITSPTTQTAAGWKHDPRCTLTKLLTTEIAWMDDGIIPDNAKNESSAHVLATVTSAEKQGGSCDDVRTRLEQELQ